MVSRWGRVLGVLACTAWAAAGWPAQGPDLACVPEVQELDARIQELELRLRAREQSLPLEVRGSYFYYPNPSLTQAEEDLTGTEQRADLYLRYRLWDRLGLRPAARARLEQELKALRAERDALVRELAGRRAAARARWARAQVLGREAGDRAARLEARVTRLERLWQDKLVVLEDVLRARRELLEARAEAARWRAEGRAALAELETLTCGPDDAGPGDEPAPEPVVFPDPSCDPGPPRPEHLLLRADAERIVPRLRQGVRLDLEAGYIWEEDATNGLQGGSRLGLRFVWPLDTPPRGVHTARARRWEARARARWRAARAERQALWARLEVLRAEAEAARTELELAWERRRTGRLLRGEPEPRPPELARAWAVYFDALELHARLFPQGTPACDAPPAAVFDPPPAGPPPRKRPPRVVYVWGGPSALGDPAEALEFCRAKGIDRLLVSPGGGPLDPGDGAWSRLLAALRGSGVEVDLLLAENAWARPGRTQGLEERLDAFRRFQQAAAAGFSGLHLDVEPQALPGWPRESAELLQGLAAAVERARARIGPNHRLGVSLPLWFAARAGPDVVARIAAAADEVVLMAYEEPAGRRLAGADEPWRPARAFPAVNARAFGTEGGLEREIARIAAAWPGAGRVAVHDWAAWRRLAASIAGE